MFGYIIPSPRPTRHLLRSTCHRLELRPIKMFPARNGTTERMMTILLPIMSEITPPAKHPRIPVIAQQDANQEVSSNVRAKSSSSWRLATRMLLKAMVDDAVIPAPKQQHIVAYHYQNNQNLNYILDLEI